MDKEKEAVLAEALNKIEAELSAKPSTQRGEPEPAIPLSVTNLEYDPADSFAEGSPGVMAGRLISVEGKVLDIPFPLWEAGREAYQLLTDIEGKPLTKESLKSNLKNLEDGLNQTFDLMEEMEADGRLTIATKGHQGNTLKVLDIRNSSDPVYQLNFVDTFTGNAGEELDFQNPTGVPMAGWLLTCLAILNDAKLALWAGDGAKDWPYEILSDMRDCLEKARISEAVKNAMSKRAHKAAKHRHKETDEIKKSAITFYKENKSRFRSRIALARAFAKREPVTERTADNWIKEYLQSASKE